MPSDVLQPNPPPSPIKTMLGHKCPSATPQKIPSSSLLSQPQLSLPLKRNTHFYFSPPISFFFHTTELCGLYWVSCPGQSFHRENREGENLLIFPFPSSLFPVSLPLYCFVLLPSVPLSLLHYFNRTHLSRPPFSTLFVAFCCLCS